MARRSLLVPALFVSGGALAALAYWRRSDIAKVGNVIIDASKSVLFTAALPSEARGYSDVILRVSGEEGVDPFLIAALGQRESNWGATLTPPGPGGTGDNGHGHGFMQIDDRWFGSWLAANDWTDPYTNVKKGVQIWKAKRAYIVSRVPGLAPEDYDKAATAAYNTGEGNVVTSLLANRAVDTTTANGNYSKDVLGKMASYTAMFFKAGGAPTIA